MHKRINISLPESTLGLLDRVTSRGNRSRLIDVALRHYLRSATQNSLRRQLAECYQQEAQHDLEIAAEWFPLEEQVGKAACTEARTWNTP